MAILLIAALASILSLFSAYFWFRAESVVDPIVAGRPNRVAAGLSGTTTLLIISVTVIAFAQLRESRSDGALYQSGRIVGSIEQGSVNIKEKVVTAASIHILPKAITGDFEYHNLALNLDHCAPHQKGQIDQGWLPLRGCTFVILRTLEGDAISRGPSRENFKMFSVYRSARMSGYSRARAAWFALRSIWVGQS